jgi:hypothetical protein
MQTDLDDFEAVLPELTLPENQLCDIEISETDIEDANWPVIFHIIRIVVLINRGYISFFPVAG